jgi:hypothetical protein
VEGKGRDTQTCNIVWNMERDQSFGITSSEHQGTMPKGNLLIVCICPPGALIWLIISISISISISILHLLFIIVGKLVINKMLLTFKNRLKH